MLRLNVYSSFFFLSVLRKQRETNPAIGSKRENGENSLTNNYVSKY